MEIIFEDNTELAEFEAINKGHRGDIIVRIKEKKYRIFAISITRLQQDFDSEQQCYGYYFPEPNMVFVVETSKTEITRLIKELYRGNYFNKLDKLGFE